MAAPQARDRVAAARRRKRRRARFDPAGVAEAARGRDHCSMSKLSIVIPVLDEGEGIAAALDRLSDLRALGTDVIVVDGGSRAATIQRAGPRPARAILAPRERE